jgi:haloacetate dehalogenase
MVDSLLMEDFSAEHVDVGRTTVFVRRLGSGTPVLLLHGFPETHLMWRDVAPSLAHDFTVVCADLPGYGQSGCPKSSADHSAYAKREMAKDLLAAMQVLGFARFFIVGHDRGGRVAYRLALDHPDRVERLAVLDIVPTASAWDAADATFALGYWPWSLLVQPEPLPETILQSSPEAIVDNALGSWGSPGTVFPEEARQAYINSIRDPDRAHAICEEYRAAASLDRLHDRNDLEHRTKIMCPVLALWATSGPLDTWYQARGGPLALWRAYADQVEGHAVQGGHFFPEAQGEQTASILRRFLAG